MKIHIAIERSIQVAAPYARASGLLKDLEGTLQRFPKLKKLKKLKDDSYLWEMDTIGSRLARIAHDVSYGAQYTVDTQRGEIRWTPLPQHGNAEIEGVLQLKEQGGKTELYCKVKGELRDVPVPLVYRLMAPSFIEGKFTSLVDIFLQRNAEAMQS